MNKSVEETSTDPRDSLSKYFDFHILPSNSPANITALTNLYLPHHVSFIRPKVSFYIEKFYEACGGNIMGMTIILNKFYVLNKNIKLIEFYIKIIEHNGCKDSFNKIYVIFMLMLKL